MDSRFKDISTADIYAELIRREEKVVVHIDDIPEEFYDDVVEAYTREEYKNLTKEEYIATLNKIKDYIAVDTRPFGQWQ